MKKKRLPIGLFLLSVVLNPQEVISTQGDSYSNGTLTAISQCQTYLQFWI